LECLARGGRQVRACPRSVMVDRIPTSLDVRDDEFTSGTVNRVSRMQLYLLTTCLIARHGSMLFFYAGSPRLTQWKRNQGSNGPGACPQYPPAERSMNGRQTSLQHWMVKGRCHSMGTDQTTLRCLRCKKQEIGPAG
jgi:hypothetical protein